MPFSLTLALTCGVQEVMCPEYEKRPSMWTWDAVTLLWNPRIWAKEQRVDEQRSWHMGGMDTLKRQRLSGGDVTGGMHGKEWHLHEER